VIPPKLSPDDPFCLQEAVDENEQVFHHEDSDEDGKKSKDPMSPTKQAREVLSAEIAKLSINDQPKAN
jgi:hypothetical protein